MYLGRAVDLFLEGYFSTCERSAKTIAAYQTDLDQACRHFGRRRHVAKIRPDELEAWAQRLKDESYAPASIRRKFAVLRVFFHYWVRRGHLDTSPLWKIRLDLKKTTTVPRVLSYEEIQAIRRAAKRRVEPLPGALTAADHRFRALRDLTIIEILFATGIRIGELTNLRLDDYSPESDSFLIRGKGGRERLALLPDPTSQKTVANYVSHRQRLWTDSRYLFINTHGNRLSTQGAANVVTNLAVAASLERHVTPHMFRHTVATLLLRNGADIRVVQEFLGHSSISTTQRYTQVTKEHLRRTLDNHHPNRVGVDRGRIGSKRNSFRI